MRHGLQVQVHQCRTTLKTGLYYVVLPALGVQIKRHWRNGIEALQHKHASRFKPFKVPAVKKHVHIPPPFPQTSPQPSRAVFISFVRIDIGCSAFGISVQFFLVERGIPQISQVSATERKDSTAVPPSSSAGAAPRGRKICHLAANS